MPPSFDCCRRKNSLQRNFSPNGVQNGDILFEIYQNPDFRHHHHTRITGHFSASTTTATQNSHAYVIFNAEFVGVVQISDSFCAIVIKLKKTELPGKTSWKIPIWLLIYRDWPFSEKIQFATLSPNIFKNNWVSRHSNCFLSQSDH